MQAIYYISKKIRPRNSCKHGSENNGSSRQPTAARAEGTSMFYIWSVRPWVNDQQPWEINILIMVWAAHFFPAHFFPAHFFPAHFWLLGWNSADLILSFCQHVLHNAVKVFPSWTLTIIGTLYQSDVQFLLQEMFLRTNCWIQLYKWVWSHVEL